MPDEFCKQAKLIFQFDGMHLYFYPMPNLNITTIQTPLFWEDKAANLAMLEQKILTAPGSSIVVLPEMFSTGFSMKPEWLAEPMDGTTVLWMEQLAAQQNIIITGSLMVVEDHKFYNRMVWILPNGQLGFYDKRHLFAYGDEDAHYTRGNKKLLAQANGWKLNLQVCYDLRFPVWSRQTPATTDDSTLYDVLIYVANWPERRSHAWRTLLQARAIENQCYVVGVNRIGEDAMGLKYIGDTMVIDPLGAKLYHAENREEIHTTTLDKAALNALRTKLPFWKDGDGFEIVESV